MRIVYAREPYPAQNVRQTIFLAGPTPRDLLTPSWRRDALLILEALGFAGDVYVPEARTPSIGTPIPGGRKWNGSATGSHGPIASCTGFPAT